MFSFLLRCLLQHSSSEHTCSKIHITDQNSSLPGQVPGQSQDIGEKLIQQNSLATTMIKTSDSSKNNAHYAPNRTCHWRKSAMALSRNHNICWWLSCTEHLTPWEFALAKELKFRKRTVGDCCRPSRDDLGIFCKMLDVKCIAHFC